MQHLNFYAIRVPLKITPVIFLFFSCAVFSCSTVPDTFLWQHLEEGVGYTSAKIKIPSGKKLKIHAVKIDVDNAALEIIVNPVSGSENIIPPVTPQRLHVAGACVQWVLNPSARITSTTVSGFAKKYNCIAAINAGPFSPSNTKIGQDRQTSGIFISDGILVSNADKFDAIVFYKNGGIEILEQNKITNYDSIKNAVGGFYILLENGNLFDHPNADTERHPRSVVGLSQDNKTIFFMTIDGRRLGNRGAFLDEAATLIRNLGAYTALNLDGGGSTALALNINGKIKTVNKPVHKIIPGIERAVATCLGVVRVF
ncbi:MAG: phosphodiester glycosidase family protein [Termitinemataceae bacterium]|nr:MAG: phosphodiester glycosidase family protein [Termitinemataceae bacterium]